MTPLDELHLFCYWEQLGNKWVEIAKLMGRSENNIKNNWKKVLKRENLSVHVDLTPHIPGLIEKLKQSVLSCSKNEVSQDAHSKSGFAESAEHNLNLEEMKDVKEDWSRHSIEDVKMNESKSEEVPDIADEFDIDNNFSESEGYDEDGEDGKRGGFGG